MQHVGFGRATAIMVAALSMSACDNPTRSTSVTDGSSSSPSVNLTGTWSGTAIDASGQVVMTWQLLQSGSAVTGTVIATTNVGAPVYTGGTVTGTLSGTGLTFTVTIPAGSISGLPECSLTLSGSLPDVLANSMAGTYTGTHSCLGAVLNGRLALVKQ